MLVKIMMLMKLRREVARLERACSSCV